MTEEARLVGTWLHVRRGRRSYGSGFAASFAGGSSTAGSALELGGNELIDPDHPVSVPLVSLVGAYLLLRARPAARADRIGAGWGAAGSVAYRLPGQPTVELTVQREQVLSQRRNVESRGEPRVVATAQRCLLRNPPQVRRVESESA